MSVPVEKLPLQRQRPRMPALVGIKPLVSSSTEAELIFGRDVQLALQNQSVFPGHCLCNLKQGRYLMDPDDPAFTYRQASLRETQQSHDFVMNYLKSFEKVKVHYPRGATEEYHKEPNRLLGEQALESVEDIFVIFFRWTLDCIKWSLASKSNLSTAEIDEVFSGEKLRTGVAVPDVLPASQVTKYYQLLIRSGFGDQVEMLSEARCAVVKVFRDISKRDGDPLCLGRLAQRDIDICDIGQGTTDIATIRAVQNGTAFQLKFINEAIGSATGSRAIEDAMIELLDGLFYHGTLRQSRPRDQNSIEVDKESFLEGFRRGIADAKCDFANDQGSISLIYNGKGDFPRDVVEEGVRIYGRSVVVPAKMLEGCYDFFLDPIIENIKKESRIEKCLLQRHYDGIQEVKEGTKDRYIFLVGGAAISSYTQQSIRKFLKCYPMTANTSIAYFGQRDEAYVAEGGVLMLSDKELCKRRFHDEALGYIVDEDDGLRVVEWLYLLGQPICNRPQFRHRLDYEIRLDENHPDQEEIYPIMLNWQFARTSDGIIGQTYLPSADHPAVRIDQGIQVEMDRDLCNFIGWTRVEEETWNLIFQFQLDVNLVGQVVYCEISIPKNGVFKIANTQPIRTFQRLMTANLSHLCREDEWNDTRSASQVESLVDQR